MPPSVPQILLSAPYILLPGLMGVIASLAFIFVLHLSTNSLLVQGAPFIPKDNHLIACGSSDVSVEDSDGRKWDGDETPPASHYLAGNPASVVASTSVQNPNLPGTVPFLNARIFTSPAEYSFPVTPGRHWLRLYFYPFAFEKYDPNLAIVTVSIDSYTLIKNMSITREIKARNYAYIQKEFSINVASTSLLVSFIPGEAKDAYAIVNGIEVVSMPDDMFASSIERVDLSTMVRPAMSATSLQTMYRVNMGGQAVSAANDELAREWVTDIEYIPTAATGVASSTENPIEYVANNSTIAPQIVYQTARTMTNYDSVNINFNLTWSFSVDPDPAFMYYIRLHFCEFEYDSINVRAFDIFINAYLAESAFDVIARALFLSGNAAGSAGEFKAVVMDYAVAFPPNTTWDASNVVVALHPTNASAPQKFNAILNGLEIFKLNDSSGNLQGSPPPIVEVPSGAIVPRGSSKTGLKQPIIGGVVGAAAAVALLVAGCIFCLCRRKKGSKDSSEAWLPLPLYGSSHSRSLISKGSTASPKSAAGSYASSAPSHLSRHFTFEEIASMTGNFDEGRVLGVGGFGKVYEGELEDGTKVAVKRGNSGSEQGVMEFQTEIELLSKLRHRHLVSLIGYCEEHNEMILVYDCMANGPLRGHLYGTDLPPLSWKQRLEICIGAARGLHYLHTGSAHGIIHRDVKTTNILLDEKLVAKVSDFGLSKTGPTLDHTHVSTAVKGSFGYLDPEYFRRQQLTEKSDVYSFGVVLMEVLCARPVINPTLPREQINLAEWALKWQKQGMLDQIIDPYLVGKISRESLKKFAETAERCLQDRSSERPTMGDVLWNLEYTLQLHESSVEKALDESKPRIVDLPIRVLETSELDDSSEVKVNKHSIESHSSPGVRTSPSEDSDDASISAVFSQLVNPQGR
ncbi:hypothetical protein GOP47_0020287 [Adiantum capillus-veneris]|uniref:non-specific serine/threonine protein kinase n=1 Tax=Adiantum capillus-veneris TaxID=13818 RepID=A0A9D4UDC9_ADICA|nr:hypothetical protein GOP47_0020287 [Adiantum capillus-veneris]